MLPRPAGSDYPLSFTVSNNMYSPEIRLDRGLLFINEERYFDFRHLGHDTEAFPLR